MAIRDEADSRGPGTMIFDPRRIKVREGFNTRDMESEATKQHIREIAKRTGWSVSTIQNFISIADAPNEITEMVKDGKVSTTLATKMIREAAIGLSALVMLILKKEINYDVQNMQENTF